MSKQILNGVTYGKPRDICELTQAQYDALSNAEKMNGILYCIKDTGIVEGDQYAPVIYSFEEREIGTYTDGKPLYEKTVKLENPTLSPAESTYLEYISFSSIGISNIDTIFIVEGHEKRSSGTIISLNFRDQYSSANDVTFIHCQPQNARFMHITNASSIVSIIFTIRYTKTTDIPGSGAWAIDGVPMVHYNENEKIIGTWFGKPLYEKSYHSHFVTDAYSLTIPFTDISNLGHVLDIKGAVMQSDNTSSYTSTGNTFFHTVPFAQALLTIASVAGYGIFTSSGIKIDRTNNTAYGSTPHVFITLQYTKTTD